MKDLQKKIVAFRNARDWEQFHNPKDLSLSLVLEAGEVMEHFQWKSAEEVAAHIKSHKSDIADELADVLSYLLLLAHGMDIDLEKAFEAKLKKNAVKYPVKKARGNHTKYNAL